MRFTLAVLFGTMESGDEVENPNLTSVSVTDGSYVETLAGENDGSIDFNAIYAFDKDVRVAVFTGINKINN